ncbi:acyl carrier protein [Ramlibacter algicola]|uniref:Acyl carrier protein n=1 Tax=Ramlibacter algicola TaxID=2795217 RepID=A0A934PZG6_9BURK|nr:acyl carrier protein [Ramlibacter algicola]MBK0391938.1 acyl carrier protein [Ramlibacter algicola]
MDKRLAGILAEVFDMRPADIHIGLERADVGTWDSLKQMDLVLTVEREYDIALDMPDIIRMLTVRGIVDVLRDKGVALEA